MPAVPRRKELEGTPERLTEELILITLLHVQS